jgi:hypothetical protein
LVSMTAGNMVGYANALKKGVEFVISPSPPIGLNSYNFPIK